MNPYMCVTRPCTISLRISGVNLFSSIALIIEGLHLLGIVKLSGDTDGGPLLVTETVKKDIAQVY